MKKILFAFCFCCVCQFSHAQDVGEYVILLDVGYLKNTGYGMKGIEYKVYVSDNDVQDILFIHPDRPFGDGETVYINEECWNKKKYTADLLPKEICFYMRRWWGWGGDKENYDGMKSCVVGLPKPVFTANVPANIFDNSETSMKITVKPYGFDYWYFDASGNPQPFTDAVIPDNHAITIKTHTGFSPETYNWEYSLDNDHWSPFPDDVKLSSDRSEITFKGSDLRDFDVTAATFFVRINCDTHTDKQALLLRPCRSGPEIVGFEYDKELCPNDNNARVRVFLSREVTPDERFYVKVDNQIFQWAQQEILADKRTVQVQPITTGNHEFSIWGGAEGQPFFTGAPVHYHYETIEPRKPIDFVIKNHTSVSCYGGSDGELTVAASRGGEVGAQFRATLTDGSQAQTSGWFGAADFATFENLQKGVYEVRVTDEQGCAPKNNGQEVIYTVTIDEPPMAVRIADQININHPKGARQTDGVVYFDIEGGTKSYNVQVLDRATKTPISCVVEIDRSFCHISGLGAGTFDVVVTDKLYGPNSGPSCGCRFDTTVTLIAPPLLTVSVAETKPISCYQSNEGQLTAYATGGVVKGALIRYDYEWYNVADMTAKISSDSVARNLYQGAYKVKVTDKNGIWAWSEPLEIHHPDSIRLDLVVEHSDCSGVQGGKMSVVATGGTPPYTYQWSKSGEQGSEISGLEVGPYMVAVTDSRGCMAVADAQIKSPLAIDIQSTITQPNCLNPNGGSIELKLSGGSAPYGVLWLDNNSTDLKREQMSPGTYKIAITDNNGCQASYQFTLIEPHSFTVVLPEDITMCRNQSRTIKAECKEPKVVYRWYCNDVELPSDGGNSITASKAGVYRVVATNEAGCTAQDELVVAVSSESLNLEMIAPTKVAMGTEIHAVNLSTVSAETLTWTLPQEAILLKKDDTEAVFVLGKAGFYPIALQGSKNGCSTVVTRTVEVVGSGDEQLPNDKKSLIKQFLVSPNPTKDYFKVMVELNQADDFTMKLYSPSGVLVDEKKEVSVLNKSFEYEINGSIEGTYLLHLITRYDKAVLQVVVKH